VSRLAQVKPKEVGLLLVDLQNDFLHPNGAYGRAGLGTPDIVALPDRLAPVVSAARSAGVFVISTHFTLVVGRGGEPLISDHLAHARPFLGAGDFLSDLGVMVWLTAWALPTRTWRRWPILRLPIRALSGCCEKLVFATSWLREL
jgi:hypothetical protein